ncbi:23S rRNA (adenine(1618)-N(6))-methyltransferase RlmF [Vibrio sp. T187]|uniref:23S rRNA (adenine(1618)-N(6))-methyltransferase RlmF n=1 Tax=Vibrio TaxID=662 RepID=UPI0010C99B1A|nr:MULTISPECIES: 23S rRNA (adenine(1618)-N(6))-methyltransferase RlmF [Vibrio]MBW3694942.1 23S rRNA (adenine(1618)-N(6))-methyltransferase RlmF [Vibrio sp. T187]
MSQEQNPKKKTLTLAKKKSKPSSKKTARTTSSVVRSNKATKKNQNNKSDKASPKTKKSGLHPRNQHSGRYDFELLTKALPELSQLVIKNPVGESTVNFSDPEAVKVLNRALLAHHYGVKHWDIPPGYLCPPIPGRADYIHRVADLLNAESQGQPYNHKAVNALDIGVGANCIYPIIGATEYGWKVQGSDVDPLSIKAANFIAQANPVLKGKIRCKLQSNADFIFKGIIGDNERYDVTTCNPPFHKSLEEAQKGTQRKLDNLAANRNKKQGKSKAAASAASKEPTLNFGGQKAELWCDGGEAAFVSKMAKESKAFSTQVLWFTTLLSKKENVPTLRQSLEKLGAKQIKVVEMSQGQKISRFVAWSFMDKAERASWVALK